MFALNPVYSFKASSLNVSMSSFLRSSRRYRSPDRSMMTSRPVGGAGWRCVKYACSIVLMLLPHCGWANGRESCLALNKRQELFAVVSQIREIRELKVANPTARVCRDLKKPFFEREPQTWQTVVDRKVIVFSAYYERRPEADGPSIRIIASGWQAAYNTIGDMYCHLWYNDRDYAVAVGPAIYNVIYPSTLFHEAWSSHFIICKLPLGIDDVPSAVSISPIRCLQRPGNELMVLNRKPVPKSNTHALCISALYNRWRGWEMIIEMFEIHKLLGASEITIYNQSMSTESNRTLHTYIADTNEAVNVIQWKFPGHLQSNVHCQRGALNDCMYRMGHRHRYVTITDLDEILVPRITDTWPELMKLIAKPNIGVYMFQHSYFRRNMSADDPYLITQSSFWTTDVVTPPAKIRCKSMYRADKAITVDLHFPYKLVRGAAEYMMPPAEGMLHHYRPYPMETFAKHPERFRYIEDRYIERYKNALVKAFTRRRDLVARSP